jgi:hypothetical protein
MQGEDDLNAVDGPALTALCDVIAEEVLAHIVANAVVSTTVTGVSAPDLSGGAVTGTGTGGIT